MKRARSMAVLTSDGRSLSPAEIGALFVLPAGTRVAADASAAAWVDEALGEQPWATVRSEIPAGFESYARVLHPAWRDTKDGGAEPVRWTEVAMETGRTVHPLMQFERIAGIPDDPNAQPPWGSRPRANGVGDVAGALIPILRRHTTTPDRCVLGVWEGYGGLDMVPALISAPRASKPGRSYLLFEGPLEAVLGFNVGPWEAPNIWWPEDRAWFVSTDIDLDSTYIGGRDELIGAILAEGDLEAFPAEIGDRVDIGADEINPPNLSV